MESYNTIEVAEEDSTQSLVVVPVEDVAVVVTPTRKDVGVVQRRELMVEEEQGERIENLIEEKNSRWVL